MNLRQALTLYFCHALSAWSTHTYEFAVVLFAAAAFPNGHHVAALASVGNGIAAILFGPLLGRWIDRAQSRLRPMATTISINKAALVLACVAWQFIIQEKARPADDREAEVQGEHTASTLTGTPKLVAFALVMLAGLAASLSQKANTIAMERDWIPTLAPPALGEGWTLVHVNAMMARIDMACRILAPLVVSQFFVTVSPKLAALLFMLGYSLAFYLELSTAERLYKMSDGLQEPKTAKGPDPASYGWQQQRFEPRKGRALVAFYRYTFGYASSVRAYFGADVWAASLAMCITRGSILSLGGATGSFLLNSGFSLQLVTVAQTLSAFCELGSTFITPVAVQKLRQAVPVATYGSVSLDVLGNAGSGNRGPDDDYYDDDDTTANAGPVTTALAQIGLYGITWICAILLPVLAVILYLVSELRYPVPRHGDDRPPTFSQYPFSAILLFGALALARLGYGTLDLATQQLGQSRVAPSYRCAFAGVEVGFIGVLGLAENIATYAISEPREFGSLAPFGWTVLACGALLYMWWTRREGISWDWQRGRPGPLRTSTQ